MSAMPRPDREDIALDERFAAGDAHLGDAELRGDAHRAQQLLLRQHIRVAPLADTSAGMQYWREGCKCSVTETRR